ncbi:hypothetical protein GA0004734_00034000 [Rhizobium sp. 9140]|nr:hypothetical protein GA0004734_00034000 [Rhizobium sp. 9140]
MNAPSEIVPTPHAPEMTELQQVLAYHNGNTVAAVETLLKDCRHLREQLTLAGAAASIGFTRGWRPVADRD